VVARRTGDDALALWAGAFVSLKIYVPPKARGKLPYWYREERGLHWKRIAWLAFVIGCLLPLLFFALGFILIALWRVS